MRNEGSLSFQSWLQVHLLTRSTVLGERKFHKASLMAWLCVSGHRDGESWKGYTSPSDAGADVPQPSCKPCCCGSRRSEHLALESFSNSYTTCPWVERLTFLAWLPWQQIDDHNKERCIAFLGELRGKLVSTSLPCHRPASCD